MNNEKYIVLYSDKKPEDIVMIESMFANTQKINLGWIDLDFVNNMKIIEKLIKSNIKQVIFWGLEIGWDKLVENLKENYKDIIVKVVCNTNDSLLYYEYERNNFFKMLELSKKGLIDKIAFLRRGQYETYHSLGYNCCYLRENYSLSRKVQYNKKNNEKMQIGIYPLNYTWDKNIFNQLCIPKFIDDSILNYNCLDLRMEDFLKTMNIEANADKLDEINEENIIKSIPKNDIIIATSFTEYVHPIFFMSMELGIPCLIGNNSDLFESDEKLRKYVVTTTEDNPIVNAEKLKNIIKNKSEIMNLYTDWKKQYNGIYNISLNEFLENNKYEVS